MFSYEFCKIHNNTFFTEHLRTTASAGLTICFVCIPVTLLHILISLYLVIQQEGIIFVSIRPLLLIFLRRKDVVRKIFKSCAFIFILSVDTLSDNYYIIQMLLSLKRVSEKHHIIEFPQNLFPSKMILPFL